MPSSLPPTPLPPRDGTRCGSRSALTWKQSGVHISFLLLVVMTMLACITTFVLLSDSRHPAASLWQNFWQSLLPCLLAASTDYIILRRKRLRPNVCHIVSLILDWTFCSIGGSIIGLAFSFFLAQGRKIEIQGFFTFLLWNTLIISALDIYLYHLRELESRTALAQAEREKARWQYEALKMQVNPHFLFNSLNALAALAWQDASRTNLFAKQLASVYRYLLTTAERRVVALHEELSFLESYVYLERIRLGEALCITIEEAEEERNKGIIPVSLQILVENALKHNICTAQSPLHITVSVKNGCVSVKNNLQPRPSATRTGIGLSNLRNQYALFGLAISINRTAKCFTVILPLLPFANDNDRKPVTSTSLVL